MTVFSLIICTRNRANQLSATLGSISAACAHYAPNTVDVVIVNNGSTDDTQHVVEEWLKNDSIPARCIFEETPGLSNARNTGVAHATGDVLAFSDDDCVLAEDFFTAAHRYYSADTLPIIRGGKVTLGDPTDAPFSILLSDTAKQLQRDDFPCGFIIGANMMIPKVVFEKIGVFDSRFGAGAPFKAAEESDVIYRAFKAGIAVHYVPDIIVHHFHGRKDVADIAKLSQGYFLASGALFAKHVTDWQLLRHFYWDAKQWLKHIGTPHHVLEPELQITYHDIMRGYVKGFCLYLLLATKRMVGLSN